MSAFLSATGIYAQSGTQQQQKPAERKALVIVPTEAAPAPVAKERESLCGGYLSFDAAPVSIQLVGGEQEQEQRLYSEGNYVYIDAGRAQGIQAGQEFSVIRPRGNFKSPWSKKGQLGVYTQQLGIVKVVSVNDGNSVALVKQSCEPMLLGDLLVSVPPAAPVVQLQPTLDRFADPSGRQQGRIVLAGDGRITSGVNNVVYIDLGTEDNIKPGDAFTIYRTPGTGRIVYKHEEEISRPWRGGFESEAFRNGGFSNDSPRSKDQSAPNRRSETVTIPYVKHHRPTVPRKIVGELVVTNVQQKTATAVITKVAQEVLTGDIVELK
jgi:hypothetical protein